MALAACDELADVVGDEASSIPELFERPGGRVGIDYWWQTTYWVQELLQALEDGKRGGCNELGRGITGDLVGWMVEQDYLRSGSSARCNSHETIPGGRRC